MFKILLNIFYLRHAPNVNEGHESGRFMIEISAIGVPRGRLDPRLAHRAKGSQIQK